MRSSKDLKIAVAGTGYVGFSMATLLSLMTHAFSKLYNILSTGLRFFTVYGPAGRPGIAYFGFTNKLVKGDTIQMFNYGNCKRNFTYIDDIVEGGIRPCHLFSLKNVNLAKRIKTGFI